MAVRAIMEDNKGMAEIVAVTEDTMVNTGGTGTYKVSRLTALIKRPLG